MHEAGELVGSLSRTGQAAVVVVRRFQHLGVLEFPVSVAIKHLEHHPHALGAEFLSRHYSRGVRELRLLRFGVTFPIKSRCQKDE